jgi:endonuclease YncB( thermonuclease family)
VPPAPVARRLGLALALLLAGCHSRPGRGPAVLPAATAGAPRQVERIEDGDTIRLADGAVVRYLGIDTPERDEPLHAESVALNRELVGGRQVTLDWGGPEESDRYGRLLAVVRVAGGSPAEAEAEPVNVRLVRAGLASVYVAGPESLDPGYLESLLAAQRQAIDARRGLWRRWLAPRPAAAEPLIATRFRIHRRSCRDLQNARPRAVTSLEEELRQGRSPCRGCKPLEDR